MSFLHAAMYRLFASVGKPGRSLRVRTVLFGAIVVLLGSLSYRLAPAYYAASNSPGILQTVALLCVATYLLTTLLFVVLDSHHKTFMRRLAIVHYFPLRRAYVRALYGLAYLPLSILAAMIIVPGFSKVFAGTLDSKVFFAVLLPALVLAVASNILLRITASRWAQLASAVGICIAMTLSGSLLAHGEKFWPIVVAGALVMGQFILCCRLLLVAPNQPQATSNHEIREHTHLTIAAALVVRAFRNRRYRATNGVVLCVGLAGILLAWSRPSAIPFDAVAVITLLLAGTLGQEARSLSRRRYPLELVHYSQLTTWLCATWRLALCNVLLFILAVLAVALFVFPGELSVSYGYVVCVGACLVAASIVVGSVVTPQKSDILGQLASAGLYACMAWGICKAIASIPGAWLPPCTIAAVMVSLGAAYLAEHRRWLITIRRTYGFVTH